MSTRASTCAPRRSVARLAAVGRGTSLAAAALASLVAALTIASTAAAAPAVDGEFPLPAGQTVGSNNEIVEGPDGNMWVTTEQNAVVRITPSGTVQGPFSTTNSVTGITAGPDGNLWASTTIGVTSDSPE